MRLVVEYVTSLLCFSLSHRFLTVQPTTPEDVSLLTSVLQFVYDLLGVPASAGLLAGPAQLESLVRTTAGRGTVCLQLLHSSLQCVEHRHSIDPYRCVGGLVNV